MCARQNRESPFVFRQGSKSRFRVRALRDFRADARGAAPKGADRDGDVMRQADGLRRSADTARQLAVRRDLLWRFVVVISHPCQSVRSVAENPVNPVNPV